MEEALAMVNDRGDSAYEQNGQCASAMFELARLSVANRCSNFVQVSAPALVVSIAFSRSDVGM